MAVVKQLWAQIGVNVTIQNMETNALFTKYMNGDYEASDPLPSITSDVLVPDELALAWLDPNGVQKGFWSFYKSPQAWNLTLAANSTTDEAKRKQLFGQIQQLTMDGRPVGAALLRAGAYRAALERPELPHAGERLVESLGGLEELKWRGTWRAGGCTPSWSCFIVTFVAFLLIHLVPGDPVRIMLGAHAPPSAVAQVRQQLASTARSSASSARSSRGCRDGDLGTSISLQRPVRDIVGPRIWPSVFLLVYGTLISLLVAVPLGVFSALLPQPARRPHDPGRRHGRPRDAVVLVRAAARRALQPAARLAARLRLRLRLPRPSREPDAARDHRRHLPRAADHPHAALQPDRDALGRLRHLGTGPRLPRDARRRQARAPQRADRHDHHPRDQHRLPDQRQRGDRERLRDPGPRLAAGLVDPDARLPDHLGADAHLRRARDPTTCSPTSRTPSSTRGSGSDAPRRSAPARAARTRRPTCCTRSSGAHGRSSAGARSSSGSASRSSGCSCSPPCSRR